MTRRGSAPWASRCPSATRTFPSRAHRLGALNACWRVQGAQLHLTYPGDSPPEGVVITYPRVAKQLARLTDDASNVPSKRTIAGRTLDGVALPIGATATWEVSIPKGDARLSAELALEPSMRTSLRSMSADIELTSLDPANNLRRYNRLR